MSLNLTQEALKVEINILQQHILEIRKFMNLRKQFDGDLERWIIVLRNNVSNADNSFKGNMSGPFK
jgi:hypothetical protein